MVQNEGYTALPVKKDKDGAGTHVVTEERENVSHNKEI